jgi:hypothetical protein
MFVASRPARNSGSSREEGRKDVKDFFSMMEKLQGLFDSDDVEIITEDGRNIRGRIDNLRSTQPFSKPAVKVLGADGQITKILFADIKEIIDHRTTEKGEPQTDNLA